MALLAAVVIRIRAGRRFVARGQLWGFGMGLRVSALGIKREKAVPW
jgi:hypothetical protein